MHDRLLNEKEASQLISVKANALRCWRSQGKGPRFVKVGRAARYRLSDINEYIKQL